MEANKDGGTSVGFSNLVKGDLVWGDDKNVKFVPNENGKWYFTDNNTIDFKIQGNLKVIESNIEDEFVKWLDLVLLFNDQSIFGNPKDDLQTRLLKQVKEKYLEIKSKYS